MQRTTLRIILAIGVTTFTMSLGACGERPSTLPQSGIVEDALPTAAVPTAPNSAPLLRDATPASAAASSMPRFSRYAVADPRFGGLPAASVDAPVGWRTQSAIDWDLGSATNPAHAHVRIASPDGSAWFESFPLEVFAWLSVPDGQAVGARSFGNINYPNVTVEEAMRRFVIARYRGSHRDLQVIAARPVANLARRLANQDVQGDSIVIRVRYQDEGHAVDEDFYGFLAARESFASDGPLGRMFEYHRGLFLVHSLGARDGGLEAAYPVLSHIAASTQPNPAWQQKRQQTVAAITQSFQQQSARNYAGIAAAGRRSAAISAGNDAMIASMDAHRAAANARSSSRAGSGDAGGGFNFDDAIRGTERMDDPGRGVSEQSINESYHWTDGNGHYRNSNDAGFDPNVGGSGTWTQMAPVGK